MTICLSDLSVSYGDQTVLDAITLEVEPGEWLAPIGPNGAGKSTLLLAIAGLLAHSGRITIGDLDVAGAPRRALARAIAFVPQRPELPPTMTVADYVLLGRTPHIAYLGSERRVDRDVVFSVLERLELLSFAHRTLGAISGGEAQRAVLARALAQESPVLLLDEPTSSLDLGHQQQVLELVDALRHERDLTVVSAMHDLTLAAQFTERICLIDRGRVVALGAPKDVLTEEAIARHYGAAVSVTQTSDGTIAIVPRRGPPARREAGETQT